jgi:hypothetical protein
MVDAVHRRVSLAQVGRSMGSVVLPEAFAAPQTATARRDGKYSSSHSSPMYIRLFAYSQKGFGSCK